MSSHYRQNMPEGTQIGRFQLQEELGHGGMGTVYRAEDPVIGRHVAIKIIHLDDTGPPEVQRQLAQSFLREIHTAGSLQHPGIVSIFDAGKQESVAYIVMELVAGVTFEAMLRAEPRAPLADLLGVCRQAATALDYAHAHGVLHRDVKPSNILVQPNGIVKIVDFGIAKAAQASTLMLSQAGTTLGTPDYMSPEQILGKTLDGRTDQWSLAVVAYMALTGVKPFQGEHFTLVMERITNRDPQPPAEVNPALPPPVNTVMAKALAKDPAQRFGNCSEFMAALETACSAAASGPVAKPEPEAEIATVRTVPPKRASRWPLAAAGLLLAVVAVAVIFALRKHPPAEPIPAPVAQAPAVIAPKKHANRPPAKVAEAVSPAAAKPSAPAEKKAIPETARLKVRLVATPPDAEITVDDAPCPSPCSVDLPAGQHSVRATKNGYTPLAKQFVVDSDQQEVPIVLEQVAGSLKISTVPEGATISVDGTLLGSTTPTTIHLTMGHHSITLTKDGFAPYTLEPTVADTLVQVMKITLAPTPAH
jgi:serine/threonine-protein kinase